MQDDPCTLHRQDEMAIGRTLSQPRRIFDALLSDSPARAKTAAIDALHAGLGRGWLPTTRIGARPPVVQQRRSCFGMSATRCDIDCANTSSARFATQDLRLSTGRERVPARVKDGSLKVSHRRWRRLRYPVRQKFSGLMAAGCGAGADRLWRADSVAICVRNTVVC